jgi:hypothetical protein
LYILLHFLIAFVLALRPPVRYHHSEREAVGIYIIWNFEYLQIVQYRLLELSFLYRPSILYVLLHQQGPTVRPSSMLGSILCFYSNGRYAYQPYRNNLDGIYRSLFCGDAYHQHYRDHQDAYDVYLKD